MERAAATISWLHLTDLHVGMSEQAHLWPNVRNAFLTDLERLCAKTGPWSLVFFTGDLVQSGSAEVLLHNPELRRHNRATISVLWFAKA